jgi:hypothetical protein
MHITQSASMVPHDDFTMLAQPHTQDLGTDINLISCCNCIPWAHHSHTHLDPLFCASGLNLPARHGIRRMPGTVRTTRPLFNLARVVINALPPNLRGGLVAEIGPGMAQAPFRGPPRRKFADQPRNQSTPQQEPSMKQLIWFIAARLGPYDNSHTERLGSALLFMLPLNF